MFLFLAVPVCRDDFAGAPHSGEQLPSEYHHKGSGTASHDVKNIIDTLQLISVEENSALAGCCLFVCLCCLCCLLFVVVCCLLFAVCCCCLLTVIGYCNSVLLLSLSWPCFDATTLMNRASARADFL